MSGQHGQCPVLPGLTLALVLLSGCATQIKALLTAPHADLPRQLELKTTPFIAQLRHQCGPAALAMSLREAALDTLASIQLAEKSRQP
jgi:uncharacterized lipoprotein YajG